MDAANNKSSMSEADQRAAQECHNNRRIEFRNRYRQWRHFIETVTEIKHDCAIVAGKDELAQARRWIRGEDESVSSGISDRIYRACPVIDRKIAASRSEVSEGQGAGRAGEVDERISG